VIRHGNWSLVSRGLVNVCRYICYTNPKGSAGSAQSRIYIPSYCLRPQLSSPFKQGGLNPHTLPMLVVVVLTGRIHSDHSGRVRCMANRNYGSNSGRVLIVAAQAAAQLN
jgi:hypothetical protein